MTTTYHTPLTYGGSVNTSRVNIPLGQLDSAIGGVSSVVTGLQAGTQSFTKLNLGSPTTLQIASGVITVTRSSHLIETEGLAASDILTTINGGSTGDILMLSIVNSARTVGLNYSGNIRFGLGAATGQLTMENTDQKIMFQYDGTNWNVLPTASLLIRQNLLDVQYTGFQVARNVLQGANYPLGETTLPNLGFMPRLEARNVFWERAAAATYASVGMAAGTNAGAGAVTASNGSDGTFVQQAIAASAGTFGGRRSTTFDLTRPELYPFFSAVVRTPTTLSNVRLWVGLCSAQVTNVDALAAGTSFIGFRYSTVAGDATWVAVMNDGATQTTQAFTLPVIAAGTEYRLSCLVNTSDAVFSATRVLSTSGQRQTITPVSMPSGDMGWTASAITTAAQANNFGFSRFYVEHI